MYSQRKAYPEPVNLEESSDKMSLEELNVQLDSNLNDLHRLFKRRRKLIDIKSKLLEEEYNKKIENLKRARTGDLVAELRASGDKQMLALITNLEGFVRYKGLVNAVWSQSISAVGKNQTAKSNEFWASNKKLQSQIDANLKRLKVCDTTIDKIVNQEFETCTAIDEIEEHIREILRKKEEDHIRKAEPHSQNKAKLLEILQSRQIERERVKDQKREIIKKIIASLQTLKNHRQQRVKSLNDLLFGADFNLASFQQFIDAIETIARSRQKLLESQETQSVIEGQIQAVARQSKQMADQFIKRQSMEALKFGQLNSIYRGRIRLYAMEKIFTADTIPDAAAKNLIELLKKCQEYKKVLEGAAGQQGSVKVGLSRTRQTLEVFQKILKTIDSQKQRRQRLLHQLERIQEHHTQLQRQEERKGDMQVQIQNLKNRKRLLEQHLNEQVTEADLAGYKKTSEQITEIDRDIASRQHRADALQNQLIASQRQLINVTNSIKNDFNDILKQVVPNSWMKNHDLKKLENIFELNVYLKKTFKRLNL